MFHRKKMISLIAASALVAACGGGGNDTTVAAAPGGDTGTPAPITPPSNDTPNTPPSTTPPVDTGNPPPTEDPSTEPAPVVDQKFTGNMEMVANQILYIRANRHLYLPVSFTIFEGPVGIEDIASGSPVAPIPNLEAESAASGCTIEVDGTCAIQPPAVAPAAPLAAFGLRIRTHLLPAADGTRPGAQTVVGRIAFELTERADSPMIRGGEVAEIMRFVIDNVEMATDATGRLTSARLREGAQIHVYGRNAAGVEVRESIPAPERTVRLMPLTEIPDGYGDTSSMILFMDLETGFSNAGEKLAALNQIAGRFDMHVTLSSVEKIVRPAGVEGPEMRPLPEKDLVGKAITVNTQPAVSGGGINGSAWIRSYP